MSHHIGRAKEGKNIKVAIGQNNQFDVIKEGLVIGKYESKEKAIKEGKKELLSSYISNLEEVEDILQEPYLKVKYDYMEEWKNK